MSGMDKAHILLFAGIASVLSSLIASAISPAGHKTTAFFLGLLLGPIGILIAAVLGNRPAANDSASLMAQLPDLTPARTHAPLHDVPDEITIRRDGQILGTWPLADVLDYLADGRLLPGDHYLHDPAANRWHLLSRLQ